MSQRPAERKHIQTRRRRRIVLLLPSNPLGLHPEAMFIFRPCPDHQPQNHTLNVCDNWIPGCGSHSLHKCMRARLPPLRWHCHTFMRAHTPLSIHANTHFLQFFLKETKKKPTGLQRDNGWKQVTTATSWEGLEQGVCVSGTEGSWCLWYWFWVRWGGGCYRSSCCIWLVNTDEPKIFSYTLSKPPK